jgi:hypothetical protein
MQPSSRDYYGEGASPRVSFRDDGVWAVKTGTAIGRNHS